MFILVELMGEKGYKHVKTERNIPNIRNVSFEKMKRRKVEKSVTIIVDERELEGISNINSIKYYYNKLIKNAGV